MPGGAQAPEKATIAGRPSSDFGDMFFVIGTGRCGSTLLQSILMAHPRLYMPPETQFFWRLDPVELGLHDPLREDEVEPYLARVTTDAFWSESRVDPERFKQRVRTGDRSAKSIFCWLVAERTGELAEGKSRAGEKSPRHEKYIDRILELFPEAKFIHIYRDPRDVVVSLREMKWWSEKDSVWRSARYIRKVLDRQVRERERLGPERYMDVRYEDLLDDLEAQAHRLCEFLGEEFDESMLRYHEFNRTGFRKAAETFFGQTMKPIDKSRTKRYLTSLTPAQVRQIEHVVGSAMRERGYEPDRELPPTPFWWVSHLWDVVSWQAVKVVKSVGKRLGIVPPSKHVVRPIR